MPAMISGGRHFVFEVSLSQRCTIANKAVYWLVKIARRIIIIVIGFGTAASNGIVAYVVWQVLIVVKIRPTKMVTITEVKKLDQIRVLRLLNFDAALINSGNIKQFNPAYKTPQKIPRGKLV